MKTAFCFSGELRSLEVTYPIIKECIMDRFEDYHIFAHTWNDDPDVKKINILEKDLCTKNILLEDRKSFEPKKSFYNKRDEVNVQGMLRQLYCLKMCNSLKQEHETNNNMQYDIVVRIRPDLLLLNNTNLERYAQSWNMKDYIYTADHDDHHGYNDRFYFSDSNNMNLLCNRLDILEYYSDNGGMFHYETFFKFCIKYYGLKVCRSRIEFGLLRNNGEISTEIQYN